MSYSEKLDCCVDNSTRHVKIKKQICLLFLTWLLVDNLYSFVSAACCGFLLHCPFALSFSPHHIFSFQKRCIPPNIKQKLRMLGGTHGGKWLHVQAKTIPSHDSSGALGMGESSFTLVPCFRVDLHKKVSIFHRYESDRNDTRMFNVPYICILGLTRLFVCGSQTRTQINQITRDEFLSSSG